MADATTIRLSVVGDGEVRRVFADIGDLGQRVLDDVAVAARKTGENIRSIARSADDGASRLKSFSGAASGALADVTGQAAKASRTVAEIAAAFGKTDLAGGAAVLAGSLDLVSEKSRDLSVSLAGIGTEPADDLRALTVSLDDTARATEELDHAWLAWTAAVIGAAAVAGTLYVGYQAVAAVLREADDLLAGNQFALHSEDARAFAGRLENLALSTGLSTAALRGLVGIEKELGVGEEDAAAIAGHLAEAIEGTSSSTRNARQAIRSLGVDLASVKAADYPKVFDRIVAALNQFRDGPAKLAAVETIFGTDDLGVVKALKDAQPVWSEATQRANLYADATARLIEQNRADVEALRSRKSWLGQLIEDLDKATTRSEEFRNAQAYAAEEVTGAVDKYFAGAGALASLKDMAKGYADYLRVIGHGIAPDWVAPLDMPQAVDRRPAMPPSPEMLRAAEKMEERFNPLMAAAHRYQTDMAALDEVYRAGAISLERYLALSTQLGEVMTGDTEKARRQTEALRDLAEAALRGPAAVAEQTAVNAAREATAAGMPEPVATDQEQAKLEAERDRRRNASIFSLREEAKAYRALADAQSGSSRSVEEVEKANAVAAEQAAGGTRNLEQWAQAWQDAHAAKAAYADAKQTAEMQARQGEWLAGLERETASHRTLAAATRSGSTEVVDAARQEADVAAKAEAAHRQYGVAIGVATAALTTLNEAKREAAREDWRAGLDRDIAASLEMAEAIKGGNILVARRAGLMKEADDAHRKFGVSIEEATKRLDDQHAAMAAPAIARHLADMKAQVDLQERLFRAQATKDPAAAREATMAGRMDQFQRANPYANDGDLAEARGIYIRESVNARRQNALSAHLGLDPAAHRAAAQSELEDLAQIRDAEGNLILAREDVARRQAQIDQDYRRAQIDNLMATRTFAGGAEAALREYADVAGNEARNAYSLVSNGLKGLEDSLVGIATGTKTVRQAFGDMANAIIADLARIAVRRTIVAPLANMLGLGDGGGGSGMGFLGSFFGNNSGSGWLSDWFGSFSLFHDGGVVGMPTGRSMVLPTSVFAGAPRYHNGGVVGLGPDEIPIIARRGERVQTEAQHARTAGERPVTVVMNITTPDAASFRASQGQLAAEMARAVTRGKRNL